jgi:hypothetical protein
MKKILIIITVLVAFAQFGWSQQLHQYKYGLYDDYFVNPAYVGSKDYYSVTLGYDHRFVWAKHASPKTAFLGLHSRVGQGYLFEKDGKVNKFFSKFGNMAFGFQGLFYDYGPQYEYNFGLTYGYHLKLNPNVKTKRPQKLILAFTPRIFILGFNRGEFTNNDGFDIVEFQDYIIPNDPMDKLVKANFKFDVGALYQNNYFDVGLSWLNISNSKIGFEADTLSYGLSGYGIYDSIYSSKIVLDGKLKYLNIFETNRFDVFFVPDLTFIYKPTAKDFEFFADLSIHWNFYELITTVRKELKYNIKTGVNISHTRFYMPLTLIQPYVAFDFMDFTIQYTYQFNPMIQVPGYFGGSHVSFLYAIGRDKIVRTVNNKSVWKK